VSDRRRAWARALYDAAPEASSRAAYGDALALVAAAMRDDPGIHEFLSDPSAPRGEKSRLLEAALPGPASAGEAGKVFGRFCGLLAAKGRIGLVPHIALAYRAIRDADEGIARVEVESAREMPTATLDRIARAWASYSGAKAASATSRVNTDLIAGYRLTAGSLRIDYSLAGRLERLRRELARPLGPAPGSADDAAPSDAASPGGSPRGEG
jgi:F-type H+-transporting ATPase subunit delta